MFVTNKVVIGSFIRFEFFVFSQKVLYLSVSDHIYFFNIINIIPLQINSTEDISRLDFVFYLLLNPTGLSIQYV